jgi:hydroxyacylglutathione hydrolase
MYSTIPQNNNINIFPIKAFQDNYIWVIQENDNVIVIDPGDAEPVLKELKKKNINLVAILITHKHYDHTGGVEELINNHPNVQIFGPENNEFKFKYAIIKEDDVISIFGTKVKFKVIETPGHTLDHVVYVDKHHLFCGDTLFACGCGKLFEGSYQQMFQSLSKISTLVPETKVYCAHEYTKKNIQFALTIDKNNTKLIERYNRLKDLEITIPSTLKEEIQTNPFLRAKSNEDIKLIRKRKDDF